jgi:hypothetical protein
MADTTSIASLVHPRYETWLPTWRWLGWSYEGDGPYLDGSALVPHPRECVYKLDAEGNLKVPSEVIGHTAKYDRRKELARYDNLPKPIVNTIADHQWRKLPTRQVANGSVPGQAYLDWTNDVDGNGTCLDDWLKQHQRLASVFGYLIVTLERPPVDGVARSAADEAAPVLRAYSPIDMPDWIYEHGQLREVKLLEPIARQSLLEPASQNVTSGSDVLKDSAGFEVRRWTGDHLYRYDSDGRLIGSVPNPLGRPPVLVFYARRRVRIPLIGDSLLGDPRIYRDHFNLVSEMRVLLRDQTFSMLAIQLGPDEDVSSARSHLGSHSGTDSVIFHMGGAEFIAPSDGPVAQYVAAIDGLESKIFRNVGLTFQGDSETAESGTSRRIKAMDLDRILAGLGDEAETFDDQLARLWFALQYPGRGEAAYRESRYRAAYPDEYYVEQCAEKLATIKDAQGVGFGRTALTLLRQSAIPILLPNVSDEDREAIDREIVELGAREAQDREAMAHLGDTALDSDAGEDRDDDLEDAEDAPEPPGAMAGRAS